MNWRKWRMDNEAGFGADKVYISTDASGTVTLETVFGDNNPANPSYLDINFM